MKKLDAAKWCCIHTMYSVENRTMAKARYKVLSVTPEYHAKFAAECERSKLNFLNGLEVAIDEWTAKRRHERQMARAAERARNDGTA